NVAEIPSILQTLWGWSPELEWQGSMKVGKDVVKVYGPAFSIFGVSTERAFFSALKSKQVASGFVNRHLLVDAGRGAIKRVKTEYGWLACPDWLVKALKQVTGPRAPLDNRPLHNGLHTVWDFRRIGWGAGVEERWLEFDDEIRNMPSTEERDIWIRAPEIALRIATIVAVFAGSKVVELGDLQWAIEFARYSTKHLAR